MSLERDLQDLLRDRAGEAHASGAIPHRTLRRARLQRAVVASGAALAVAALAVGGYALTGDLGPARSSGPNDVIGNPEQPAPGEVARGRIGDKTWLLKAYIQDGGLCSELSFESAESGGASVASGSASGSCEAVAVGPGKDKAQDVPLNLAVTDYGEGPDRVAVYGDVGPAVDRIELRSPDKVGLVLVLHDAPAGVDTERRFFINFLPIESELKSKLNTTFDTTFDEIVAVAADGSVLDRQKLDYEGEPRFGTGEPGPTEILSEGRVADRTYLLRVSTSAAETCISFDLVGPGGGGTLCHPKGGTGLSVAQDTYEEGTIAPVYGTLPDGTERVTLELEDGTTIESDAIPAPEGYSTGFYVVFAPSIEARGRVVAHDAQGLTLDAIKLCGAHAGPPKGPRGAGPNPDFSASCASAPGP